jgi:hypothetical protein
MGQFLQQAKGLWEWLRVPYRPTRIDFLAIGLVVTIIFLLGWAYGSGAKGLLQRPEPWGMSRPP